MFKKVPNLGKTKFNKFKKLSQSQTQLKQQNKQAKPTELFKKENSGWETHVHPWWIHVDVWQNQCNIVKYLASN